MKKIFSLFAAILFAGSIFATPAQKLQVNVDLSQGKGSGTPVVITWVAGMEDAITVTQNKGTNKSTSPSTTYLSPIRMYKGHFMSFETKAGYVIDTIILTVGDKVGSGLIVGNVLTGDTIVTSNTTDFDARFHYTKNGGKDTIINKNGAALFYLQNPRTASDQHRISAIDVRYTKEASSTPAVVAANVNYGTFVPGVSNAEKELVVVGENLSGQAITYQLMMGSQFSVSGSGTLASEGGTLTVTLTDLIGGDPMDQIQFKVGGTLMKEIELSAHVVETTGKGTQAEPFTCPDVANLNNTFAGNYWVEGYILGGYQGSGSVMNDEKNAGVLLAIATDSPIDTISVQLPNGSDIRTALNVPGNSSQGWKIKVLGSLEKYGNFAGVKAPTDYVIVSTPTAIDETEAAGKATKELREGQVLIIKGNKTYNILGQEIK